MQCRVPQISGLPTPKQVSSRHCALTHRANPVFLVGTPMRPADSLDLRGWLFLYKTNKCSTCRKQGSSNSSSPNWNITYQFQALLRKFTFYKLRSPYILNCYTTIKFQKYAYQYDNLILKLKNPHLTYKYICVGTYIYIYIYIKQNKCLNTYMKSEIPPQHGTKILCYIRHAGMQCSNQSCIKW